MDRNRWRVRGAALVTAAAAHVFLGALLLYRPTEGFFPLLHPQALASVKSQPSTEAVQVFLISQSPSQHPAATFNAANTPAAVMQAVEVDLADLEPVEFVEQVADEPAAVVALVSGEVAIHCEVHIHQDRDGRLQAIDFGDCIDDVHWQHALAQVIRDAAVMIDPPPGAVFAPVRSLTLQSNSISPIALARQLSTP